MGSELRWWFFVNWTQHREDAHCSGLAERASAAERGSCVEKRREQVIRRRVYEWINQLLATKVTMLCGKRGAITEFDCTHIQAASSLTILKASKLMQTHHNAYIQVLCCFMLSSYPHYCVISLKYDMHIFGGKWRNFVCTWQRNIRIWLRLRGRSLLPAYFVGLLPLCSCERVPLSAPAPAIDAPQPPQQ